MEVDAKGDTLNIASGFGCRSEKRRERKKEMATCSDGFAGDSRSMGMQQ